MNQRVTVLGSTGSIGINTLEIISNHSDRFSVFALTANNNIELIAKQCQQFLPQYAVVPDAANARRLTEHLQSIHCKTEVLAGIDNLQYVAEHSDVDIVMAAIVGAAGLLPTMAAVTAGKKVLLANKESLVMAGRLFMDAVKLSGAQLLPIDSEHNAIFQCMPSTEDAAKKVRKILLTGSGGPFRTWDETRTYQATPEQACNHPNWSMGKKISVDSATLMNKGLEFIEAKWLFNVASDMIDIVIHPQSIIHSMVEYVDGSILAQLGNPDMRIPIAYGLAYPERVDSGVAILDVIAAARLDFEAPDIKRFPALGLAIEAAKSGISASTVLNAANEVAVAEFLAHKLCFGQIVETLQQVMNRADYHEPESLDDVLMLDADARQLAATIIETLC